MLDALLMVLIGYLTLTYALGMYLAARLLFGRRVRQVLAGMPIRRHTRPIRVTEPEPTPPPATTTALPLPPSKAAA